MTPSAPIYDKRRLKKPSASAPSHSGSRSATSSFENQADRTKTHEILFQAQRDWESLAKFRETARRCIRYSDGKQWDDLIQDPDHPGKYIMEKEYTRRQGQVPIVQNKIFSIVRNIIGQYRQNADKSIVLVRDPEKTDQEEILTDILRAVASANQLDELDAQNLNYFLHSGALIQRIAYRYFKEYDRSDVYVENIDYNRIFFNADVKDLRLNDLCRVGVLHDLSLDQLLSQFCKNEADREFLTRRFESGTTLTTASDALTGRELKNIDFISSYDNTRLRVVECWNLETDWSIYVYDPATGSEGLTDLTEKQIIAENKARIRQVLEYNSANPDNPIPDDQIALVEYEKRIEPYWCFRFLLTDGTCLQEGRTPYLHQSHPFIMRLFPMLSGNVYGIINQTIDQQRMINRFIMLYNFVIGAGAKGVLMIPENLVPDSMSLEEFTDQWVRFNGVIVYKYDPKDPSNRMPQQITTNSVPVGIYDMINLQINLIEDISGVHSAIQGKTPSSGTSGTLYAQETQNASINTLDIMKTHSAFKEMRDRKVLQTAIQFYNGKRRIISSKSNGGVITIDPEQIRNIDFDIQIIQNMDTPIYRSLTEDRLTQMVVSGLLAPELYFENSSDPTIKKINESLKKMKEQQTAGIPPELMQAAQQGDPRAVQMLQQAVGQQQPPAAGGAEGIPPALPPETSQQPPAQQ
jgi:hypothetical protein